MVVWRTDLDHVDLDHWQPEPFRRAGVGRPQSLCPSTPSLRPVHYVWLGDRRHSQMSNTQPNTTSLPPLSQEDMPYVNAVRAYAARGLPTARRPRPHRFGGHPAGASPTCLASRYWRSTSHRWWTALIRGPVPTPMQQSAQLAAEAWGAHRTWLLTNGASKGNLVTCLALRHVGELIVAQRSMHSSVMDGMVLGGLQCHFVQPVIDVELGAAHGITPESLAEALDTFPGAVGGVRCLAELFRRGIGPSGAGRCRPLDEPAP